MPTAVPAMMMLTNNNQEMKKMMLYTILSLYLQRNLHNLHRLQLGPMLMQVPICMVADMINLSTESYKQFEFDELVGKKGVEWFIKYYVPKVRSKKLSPPSILLMCVATPHL